MGKRGSPPSPPQRDSFVRHRIRELPIHTAGQKASVDHKNLPGDKGGAIGGQIDSGENTVSMERRSLRLTWCCFSRTLVSIKVRPQVYSKASCAFLSIICRGAPQFPCLNQFLGDNLGLSLISRIVKRWPILCRG
jgi:hypothetical protein